MNEHITPELSTLPGGERAALRVARVESDDPNAYALQVEGWQVDSTGAAVSDQEGPVEAPPLLVTIPRGMLAQGTIDLEAVIATAKGDQLRQVGNTIAARAAFRHIPVGSRRPTGEAVIARPPSTPATRSE